MPTASLNLDHVALARLAARHGVERLQVFGSAATGTHHQGSDVDFLVDFLPGREDLFEDYTRLQQELGTVVGRPVDLVIRRAVRNPYFRESAAASAQDVYVAQG
ncbi:putative nucleotidyltransferase [Micrococcus cohnii]|uniref:Putative nucleotidyltransferase n=1 Tax=Micrococcus cohnii TaxID=993416 RepID=A0A7W7M3H4_9MICC|nr:nucleotidyltransferase domain-containing protein [Micrococcus cohnii]MBB4735619.1 putative nucleotidyltransferase [Micrococcus cohnii]